MGSNRSPWQTGDYFRYMLPVALAGGFIGFLMGGVRWRTQLIGHSIFISLICYSAAFAFERVFHRFLSDDAPQAWWRRALGYFISSMIGWPIGFFLGLPIFWGRSLNFKYLPKNLLVMIVVSAILGAVIGLLVYGYELTKNRLKASIESQKEGEYAQKELELARELQSRMLPAPLIEGDGYRITARNLAARFVAGDFYDVFRCSDGSLGIVVADVAGKGLAASLIMASVKAVLPIFGADKGVAETLSVVNERLVLQLGKREFVALALMRFDPRSGRAQIANAGMPDPYLVGNGGGAEPVVVGGARLPLGIRKGLAYEQAEVMLKDGESLVMLSDGLPEAPRPNGEPLGYEELAVIMAMQSEGDYVDGVIRRVQDATSATLEDDWTIVHVARRALSVAPLPSAASSG